MKIVKLLLFFVVFLVCFNCVFVFAQDANLDFSSPEAAFSSYMKACKLLDFSLVDQCYTKEFQQFTKTNQRYRAHRNTGQLSNSYRYWSGKPYKLDKYGNKAIMRFSSEFQRPEPIYFVREAGKWKIDGMFSFNNVIIQDSSGWHWRNPNRNNEREWLRK
ncbi:hypothetical protein ACFL96_04870 [Thermoproteota archaeon]